MAPLLPAGLNDGLQVGGEGVPAGALATERRLPPEYEAADFLLGVVVGWLDAIVRREAPESVPVLEDVLARAADDGQPSASAEHHLDRSARGCGVSSEGLSSDGPISDAVPFAHEDASALEEGEAKASGLAALLAVPGELSDEVRPANLSSMHVPEDELTSSVAQQRYHLLLAEVPLKRNTQLEALYGRANRARGQAL
ncbi:MAG: hypothetical protein SFW67_31810 [Myxococcaceae bacterium]|nr:hypothetical protein [Myxococcaceae bacterium]